MFKNKLTCSTVECLDQCPNEVEFLDLYKKSRQIIPSDLSIYPKLKMIMLIDCGYGAIPDAVFTCENLEIFNYCGDTLKHLSRSILNCKRLMSLNLMGNHLKAVPPVIGEIHSLEYLYLGSNEIKHIPRFLYKLENLKELRLNNNPIPEKEIRRFRKKRPDVKLFCKNYDPNNPDSYLDEEE
jgi:Leucine-rich repeat (LRR) protein